MPLETPPEMFPEMPEEIRNLAWQSFRDPFSNLSRWPFIDFFIICPGDPTEISPIFSAEARVPPEISPTIYLGMSALHGLLMEFLCLV